jgi:hypothetical protein
VPHARHAWFSVAGAQQACWRRRNKTGEILPPCPGIPCLACAAMPAVGKAASSGSPECLWRDASGAIPGLRDDASEARQGRQKAGGIPGARKRAATSQQSCKSLPGHRRRWCREGALCLPGFMCKAELPKACNSNPCRGNPSTIRRGTYRAGGNPSTIKAVSPCGPGKSFHYPTLFAPAMPLCAWKGKFFHHTNPLLT